MKKIEEFFTCYKEAVWQKDAAGLLGLYSKDLIAFDIWDQGFYGSLKQWTPEIQNWLGSLGDEKVQVDFERMQCYASDTIGFASAYISFQAISPEGKVLREMTNRISVGFSKENGVWKVVHQHISAPVSSQDLTAVLDLRTPDIR